MKLPNAPATARVPFFVVEGAGNGASVGASVGAGKRAVGSVAREHLAALRGWPGMLEVDERSVTLAPPTAARRWPRCTLRCAARA